MALSNLTSPTTKSLKRKQPSMGASESLPKEQVFGPAGRSKPFREQQPKLHFDVLLRSLNDLNLGKDTEKKETPENITIKKLNITSHLVSSMAYTRMTIELYNPNSKEYEGSLSCPLPENTTVCGYALNVAGVLVDSVSIEKEKGRQVFEEEVNKKVDPGLLEHTEGNIYKTRIYPLPAKGIRTIRIDYYSELAVINTSGGGDIITCSNNYYYEWLFGVFPKVESMVFECFVHHMCTDKPLQLENSNPDKKNCFEDLKFQHIKITDDNHYFYTTYRKKDIELNDIKLMLPCYQKRQILISQNDNKEVFFKLDDYAPLQSSLTQKDKKEKALKPDLEHVHTAILWDASGSRSSSVVATELLYVEEYTKQLTQLASKTVTLDVYVFRNTCTTVPKSFVFSCGDSKNPTDNLTLTKDVCNYLKMLDYDGGTNFMSLFSTINSKVSTYQQILMFTDGFCNMGSIHTKINLKNIKNPFYVLNASTTSNQWWISQLIRETNGKYFYLPSTAAASDCTNLMQSIVRNEYRCSAYLKNIEYDDKECYDVYINRTTNGATITGRLYPGVSSTKMQLIYNNLLTNSNQSTFQSSSSTSVIEIKSGDVAIAAGDTSVSKIDIHETHKLKQHNLIERYWASQKMNDLLLNPDTNMSAILNLARMYQLVTPYTSLIVLETLEQYQKHGIEPPKTLTDMYTKFKNEQTVKQTDAAEKQMTVLKDILEKWKSRLEWQEKYRVRGPPPYESYSKGAISKGISRGGFRSGDYMNESVRNVMYQNLNDSLERGERLESFNDLQPASPQACFMIAACASAPPASASSPAKSKSVKNNVNQTTGTITLQKWDPDMKYLKDIDKVFKEFKSTDSFESKDTKLRAEYMRCKKEYNKSIGFYFDMSHWFINNQFIDTGIRIVTNVLELEHNDPQLFRMVGYRLYETNQLDEAIHIFERVLKLRPNEPQSRRDLALALTKRAFDLFENKQDIKSKTDKKDTTITSSSSDVSTADSTSVSDLNKAIELMTDVIIEPCDTRFNEIQLTVLSELNRAIARATYFKIPIVEKEVAYTNVDKDSDTNTINHIYKLFMNKLHVNWPLSMTCFKKDELMPFFKLMDMDLRISLAWDTDNTDIDLHVIEPLGDHVYYATKESDQGGLLSRDFTGGYGPEEYMAYHALKKNHGTGTYKIQVNYFASHRADLSGETTVMLTIFMNYGRLNETSQTITKRLSKPAHGEKIEIGSIVFDPK